MVRQRPFVGVTFDPEVYEELRRRREVQDVALSRLINKAVRAYLGFPNQPTAERRGRKPTSK